MKSGALLALVVGLVVVTAILTPAVAAGLDAVGWHVRFTRVYNRVFEVLLIAAIALGWRRLDLGNPAAWGFRRDRWRAQLGWGLLVGVAGIGAGLVAAWLGGGVVPALRYAPLKTIGKSAAGFVGALVVGVGEEALFRGVLLRRLTLDMGARAGLIVTTGIYALVHALRGGATPAPGMWAGFERTGTLVAPLADPTVLAGVVGLFALGLVLGIVRQRSGSLWACVGIHAAWVGVFRVGRLFFDIRRRPAWLVGPGWPPLIGGFAGVVALAVTGVLVAFVLRRRADRAIHPADRAIQP